MSSLSTASLSLTSSSSSTSGNRGGGKVRATSTTVPKHNHRQQHQPSTSSDGGGGQCHSSYQSFNDKASLNKQSKWQSRAFLPSSSPATWKDEESTNTAHRFSNVAVGGESANRKDDDVDESRLIIDLDCAAPTSTTSDSGLTSALSSSSPCALSTVLTLRQQAAAEENFQPRTTTSIMTTNVNYLLSANVQPPPVPQQQQSQSHEGDHIGMGAFAGTSTASSLVGLAQQIQLQQQQLLLGNVSSMAARISTPRLQQPNVPGMMQSQTPSAANSYLLSAALSPYAAAAQQMLLARAAAAAAGVNGTAGLPYSYLMTAGFSPLCLPINDPALAAAAAAAVAANGGQNQNAMAAAIANAGLLVPQNALASAAAQLLCQQPNGPGIRVQGSTATPPAGCNENMGIHKLNDEATRRGSLPDVKGLQRQHVCDGSDLLVQQGNAQSGSGVISNAADMAALNSCMPPSVVASLSREAVSEHIKRLISENEAIVEPPPALLKRRSYTKCHQGSASLDISALSGMASTSNNGQCSIRPPLGRSSRSQSLIDPPSVVAASAQRQSQPQTVTNLSHYQVLRGEEMSSPSSSLSPSMADSSKTNSCQFCNISFRNVASLRAHEFRCANRVESILEAQEAQHTTALPKPEVSPVSSALQRGNSSTPIGKIQGTSAFSSPVPNGCGENKHPLKKRILAAAELDAQRFGSHASTGVVQAPETIKSILASHESGPSTPVTAGDISLSASTCYVPSSAALKQQSSMDLSAMKNVRVRTAASEAKGLVSVVSHFEDARLVERSSSICAAQNSIDAQSVNSINGSRRNVSTQNSPVPVLSHGHSPVSVLPKSNSSPYEQSARFHPYRLTFKVRDNALSGGAASMASSPKRSERVKSQLLTQTTFCCQRKQPIVFSALVPTDSKDSAYIIWPQVIVASSDAKLNVMMMGGCNVRARWSNVKYVVASANMSAMIVTDSVYWEHSKRLQRLAAAAVAASANCGPKSTQDKCSKEAETSTPVAEEDTVSVENEEMADTKPTEEKMSSEDDNMEIDTINVTDVSNDQNTKPVNTTSSRQRLKDILTSSGSIGSGQPKKVVVCNGGYKTNEAYTYVRGRGRGRYVCERCGIRCKKPSMLKKHIRTHLNVRPYTCFQCMFSFKTKGNLTKHMKSQAHTKKLASLTTSSGRNARRSAENKEPGCDRLSRQDNDSEYDTEEQDDLDGYSTEDDVEENGRCLRRSGEMGTAELRRQQYSYKNIWTNVKDGCYPGRQIRTPPPTNTKQTCVNYSELFDRCDTAPPALSKEPADLNSRDGHEGADANTAGGTKFDDTIPENSSYIRIEDEAEKLTSTDTGIPATIFDSKNQPELLSSSLEPYFVNEGKCQCEICGKDFPKIGLLRLHMNVHYFEQTGRRYEYKCAFCNSSFRSRSLLQKHMSTAHQKQMQQQQPGSAEKDSAGEGQAMEVAHCDGQRKSISSDDLGEPTSTVSALPHSAPPTGQLDKAPLSPASSSSSSANNPRPFECTDCRIAFRIHGHLSKHLRSKLHITKLENMGKLPIGLYARLEEAGNQYIAEIDTGDCATSLRSLVKLADQFNMLTSETNDAMTEQPECTRTTAENDQAPAVSLACTEEMLPTSPAPPQVSISVVQSSDLATKKLQQDQIAKYVTEVKSINGVTTKPVVLADVWIPPTVDRLAAESQKPMSSSQNGNNNNDGKYTERCYLEGDQEPETGPTSKSPIEAASPSSTALPILCRLCNANFPSSLELEIHLHADHVVMRDGNDFRCPRASCDTVYPNRDSLRHHLALHFSGRLDETHGSGGTRSETPNGCDVSKSTVAALSRKLVASSGQGTITTADGTEHQSDKPRKKTMKTHLVKLSSIPESASNHDAMMPGSVNSNSSSSQGATGAGGVRSTGTSPISACGAGIDSDASRASINSSHSTSPVAVADSPAALDGGGRCSSGRQSAKRKSLEDAGPNMPKRVAVQDHQQLLHMQAMHQQAAAMSNTPPSLNGFYQRLPTPSSMQTQSPVAFHHLNSNTANGGAMTPNSMGGWSPSPLLQQISAARQQVSPPQHFYFSAPGGGAQISPFFSLQNPLASVAMAQHKLLTAGGMNPFWNSPTGLAASHLLNSSGATSEAAAAFSEAAGFGLHDAATAAAALGLLLPQSCILCGKQYANNALLQEHLLTHSLARPYVCEHCDAGFTTEQALQSHRPCRQQRIDV